MLDPYNQTIKFKRYTTVIVPANVTDCEMFKQAMIITQFNACILQIESEYKKILDELDLNIRDYERDKLNERAYKLKEAYRNACYDRMIALDGKEIETKNTIAEIMSFVVFPCCKGNKRNPVNLENASHIYQSALETRCSMSDKTVDDFRKKVKGFMDLHTSADADCGFAKSFENRITRESGRELLYGCLGVELKYSNHGIVSNGYNFQEFTEQIVLSCLKKTYKV